MWKTREGISEVTFELRSEGAALSAEDKEEVSGEGASQTADRACGKPRGGPVPGSRQTS